MWDNDLVAAIVAVAFVQEEMVANVSILHTVLRQRPITKMVKHMFPIHSPTPIVWGMTMMMMMLWWWLLLLEIEVVAFDAVLHASMETNVPWVILVEYCCCCWWWW